MSKMKRLDGTELTDEEIEKIDIIPWSGGRCPFCDHELPFYSSVKHCMKIDHTFRRDGAINPNYGFSYHPDGIFQFTIMSNKERDTTKIYYDVAFEKATTIISNYTPPNQLKEMMKRATNLRAFL